MTTKIAIVADLGAHPWAPLVLGLLEGLQTVQPEWSVHVVPSGGAGATGHAQTAAARIGEAMLRALAPDLVLVCVHAQTVAEIRRLHEFAAGHTGEWVALSFDDPHDHQSTLRLLPGAEGPGIFAGVLSPEPLAVDWYRRQGIAAGILRPTVSTVMHWRRTAARAASAEHALAVVAGPWWAPRQQLQPALLGAVQAAGHAVVEVRGSPGPQGRWVSGRDLTALLHSARLTVDMPRTFEYPENPHQIPCTYTAPRVYIAAACGVPCLSIDPRANLQLEFPGALYCQLEDAIPATLALLEAPPAVLEEAAAAAFEWFEKRHAPANRGLELLHELKTMGFV